MENGTFTGGVISVIKNKWHEQCEQCEAEGELYFCSWGGGYEYEPAELCINCIEKAAKMILLFVDKKKGRF